MTATTKAPRASKVATRGGNKAKGVTKGAQEAPDPATGAGNRAINQRWPASTIEQRKVEQLRPHPSNKARVHSRRQISRIVASMRQWGWTMPILIDEDDMILAGHGRLEAAKRLKIEDVPVMIARGWSDVQKRAYLLADNRLTELGEWDDDTLNAELFSLDELGFNVELTGFDLPSFGEEDDADDKAARKAKRRAENDDTAIYGVIVEVDDEEEQVALLERLMAEGLKCRALL